MQVESGHFLDTRRFLSFIPRFKGQLESSFERLEKRTSFSTSEILLFRVMSSKIPVAINARTSRPKYKSICAL